MENADSKLKARNAIALIVTLMIVLFSITFAYALPTAPTINYVSNSTNGDSGVGTLRSGDDGGYITTVTLDALQQNLGWKAYVGNITGKLTLDDANNWTIYDWSYSTISANVYASRNSSVQWASVGCAARSVIDAQDVSLSKTPGAIDTINETFNGTTHKQFTVSGTDLNNCPAIATYVNDTAQSNGAGNLFQEILIDDSVNSLVYATNAENDVVGYDNSSTFDFQILVPDVAGATKTSYYFYVELI